MASLIDRTRRSLTRAILLALSLALAAPAAAAAQPDDATRRFELMLRSIDVAPTRAQLDDAWPDARARLLAAARDTSRDDWFRLRATSILTLYPDAEVRAALLELAADTRRDVRKTAIYTVARTFGAPGDEALVDAVEVYLADADADVREHALRGLRWVDHPAAERLLSRLTEEDSPRARLAKRTLERRAARIARARR